MKIIQEAIKAYGIRGLAKELGVSASYLSQVKNGKRPASEKVLSKVLSIVKQGNLAKDSIYSYNMNEPQTCTSNKLAISLAVGQRTLDP